MNSPDPKNYKDGVQFFRDMHKLVLHNCAVLSTLLDDAESRGVFASFAAKPEWDEVLQFFLKVAPQHERDEERFLFPAVANKVPHIGFQQPDAPIHFLVEGHEILQRQIVKLVHDWNVFRQTKQDENNLAESHAKHLTEDTAFIASGRELVRLYHEHVAIEEERVYSVADKVLTGNDKLELSDALRTEYGNEAVTGSFQFEGPQFSNPAYNVSEYTDARSGNYVEGEYEDEGEEESEL